MAFPTLPLQQFLFRENGLGVETRAKRFGSLVTEEATEQPNPHKRVWTLTYVPLNRVNKDIIAAFLTPLGSTRFFTFVDRCEGTSYNVRMVKNSFSITRLGALFNITFKVST